MADATPSIVFNILWLVFWLAVVRRCERRRCLN